MKYNPMQTATPPAFLKEPDAGYRWQFFAHSEDVNCLANWKQVPVSSATTPRTGALESVAMTRKDSDDFARTLERDLAAAKTKLADYDDEWKGCEQIWDQVQAIAPWCESNEMPWCDEILCGLHGVREVLETNRRDIERLNKCNQDQAKLLAQEKSYSAITQSDFKEAHTKLLDFTSKLAELSKERDEAIFRFKDLQKSRDNLKHIVGEVSRVLNRDQNKATVIMQAEAVIAALTAKTLELEESRLGPVAMKLAESQAEAHELSHKLAAKTLEAEGLRKKLTETREMLRAVPELNMGNYSQDEVDALNNGVINTFNFLESALSPAGDAGRAT